MKPRHVTIKPFASVHQLSLIGVTEYQITTNLKGQEITIKLLPHSIVMNENGDIIIEMRNETSVSFPPPAPPPDDGERIR
jgi:hypothetical protein